MKYLLFIIFSAIIFSCNTTEITTSWKADNVPQNKYKKIMVMGIINQQDRALRAELETEMVNRLREEGYDAHSALDEYGPKAFEQFTEEEIVEKLKTSKYDAILTTVLLDVSKEENYQPGRLRYQPVGVYYNRFGRYYTTIYNRVYEPGYYTTTTQYFLESNFYDLDSGDLQYSVQSKSFDPADASALSHDYGKKIVKDMKKNQIIS